MKTARATGRKTSKGVGRTVSPETVLLSLLPTDGTAIGNTRLRTFLAERGHRLRQRAYDHLRDALVAQGKAAKGRGRGGSLMRAAARPAAPVRPPASRSTPTVRTKTTRRIPEHPPVPTAPDPAGMLTLSQLESHLLEAANILRGSPVDRTDWKSYILPLLFFKRICDVWDEEHAAMIAEYGEDYADEHRFQVPEDAHWTAGQASLPEGNGSSGAGRDTWSSF